MRTAVEIFPLDRLSVCTHEISFRGLLTDQLTLLMVSSRGDVETWHFFLIWEEVTGFLHDVLHGFTAASGA